MIWSSKESKKFTGPFSSSRSEKRGAVSRSFPLVLISMKLNFRLFKGKRSMRSGKV
jgi:hypothetical protein